MSSELHFAKGSQKPEFPDDGMLCLYSMRFCPYAQRAHLVLDAKNIPYRTVYINLTEKPEWLTLVNPLSKVPALQINKNIQPVIESLIIAEYLDEAFPQNPLLPKDPLKKALDKCFIERCNAVTASFYRVFLGDPANVSVAVEQLLKGLDIVEKELQTRGTPYFGGEKPGMVDYMIWPWFERLEIFKHVPIEKFELDKIRFKLLLQWSALMVNDPAVKVSYINGENHAKYLRSRLSDKTDYDFLARL